jgi:hypothetical protein
MVEQFSFYDGPWENSRVPAIVRWMREVADRTDREAPGPSSSFGAGLAVMFLRRAGDAIECGAHLAEHEKGEG